MDDFFDVFLESILGGASDAPGVMLVVERPAGFIEVADVAHPQSLAEIDLGHAGFDAFGNIGH